MAEYVDSLAPGRHPERFAELKLARALQATSERIVEEAIDSLVQVARGGRSQ
jgi:hypothetical protein